MNNRFDEFLKVYKEIELWCREQKKDIKEIEDELGKDCQDPEANKLTLCRQIRNFIVHQDAEGFIVIAPGMIKFLKELKKDLKMTKDRSKISIGKGRYTNEKS